MMFNLIHPSTISNQNRWVRIYISVTCGCRQFKWKKSAIQDTSFQSLIYLIKMLFVVIDLRLKYQIAKQRNLKCSDFIITDKCTIW